jgi:galactose oxidase-like protein
MNTGFAKSTGKKIAASLKASFVLLLLFLGVGGQPPIVMAQTAGTFMPTGSMSTPRGGHTATLLLNGKVLITGGQQVNAALASAELYDPSSGTFAAAGNMSVARAGHTATLLTSGQVLITGGIDHPPALASAELYDPLTGTFSATGSMTIGRVGHTATLLADGRVLIAGGDNGGLPIFASAEIYDASTGNFTATGSMSMARVAPTATLLSNGKVLIDGGEGGTSPSAEIYDPATATFTQTGGTTYYASYLSSGSASLLPDGKVLLTLYSHRDEDLDPTNMAELYDPSTGTFLATGNMSTYRNIPTSTLLPDGKVLIAGLNYTAGAAVSHADLYDPASGTFAPTANMTVGRLGHTATLLLDGTVLVAGGAEWVGGGNGTNGPWSWFGTAELYHPAGIQLTPKVQIVDNDTGSLTTLAVGDTFSFQVTGAPPHSLVSVSEAGWSGSVGYTDASGLFFLNGIVGSNVVGTWQQTWTIGGVLAQPSPLQFTITPKP